MKLFSFLTAAVAVGLVPSTLGQIVSYVPSEGAGVSYSVNIPEDTASSGSGPIFLQLKGPSDLKWLALGTGATMTDGNLFVIYSAPNGSVILSPRKAAGHIEPLYDPSIQASLLDGSGVRMNMMIANIRCDNCMTLINGESILGDSEDSSNWIWAMTHGGPLDSSTVSQQLYQHDWHGIFSLSLSEAVGGNSSNPFISSPTEVMDYTPPVKQQQQISDTLLHKKRIAHGVITSVAFVLLFPNFGLLLHIFPSRYTVPWIHAPLQMFAVFMALGGLGLGISVSMDLQEAGGYHPVLGYVAVGGVVLLQPILGIMQHIHFRRTGKKSMYGVAHRWLGRFLSAFGIINGGLGFHYAKSKNPDIPPASPLAYGIISGSMGLIYVLVLLWSRYRSKKKPQNSPPQITYFTTKEPPDSASDNFSFIGASGIVDNISREKLLP